jgi:hypothetical protein
MQNFISIGKLSATFQEAPSRIAKRLERAGIQPKLSLNELRYFDESEAFEALKSNRQSNPKVTNHE